MKRTLIFAAIAALLLAPVASAAHSVSINNANSIGTGTQTVSVDVDGFNLVSFAGKDAKKGEGHIHYLVNGQDACTAGKADCSAPTDYATTAKSFTFINLEEGDEITVELVLSDHTASGTDSNGNLNGGRVLDTATVSADSNDAPGFEIAALLAGLVGLAFLARRK